MASFLAIAPGVSGLQGLAFLRGGITAKASRAAIASSKHSEATSYTGCSVSGMSGALIKLFAFSWVL